jgi:hypothetical protein
MDAAVAAFLERQLAQRVAKAKDKKAAAAAAQAAHHAAFVAKRKEVVEEWRVEREAHRAAGALDWRPVHPNPVPAPIRGTRAAMSTRATRQRR